ncbi:MAG: phosphoribosylamine--glycine ligase [Bdellovibrionales bacterium]|nr:phosphoribosylamine--glycine ligase [Bdellovibrionales bacterium]
MNTLVIGKGGREHAIVQVLKKSSNCYCFPGRDGFDVQSLQTSHVSKAEDLVPEMKEKKIDLVVIGPEAELSQGWSDVFRSYNFSVFGPSQQASQLESSKIFAKEFMKRAGIPTAKYFVVQSLQDTLLQAKHFSPPYVLKADGLAGGKGVFICPDERSLKENAQKIFEDQIFGKAGEKALLEEFQEGTELSVFILTEGKDYCVLPLAQDYKKLHEGGKGLNTGGMGAVAPLNVGSEVWEDIEKNIVKTTIKQIEKDDLFYRGVLYIGLIQTAQGLKVLEYNVRFGDPECQVILPLLDMDAAQLFYDVAQGNLPSLKFNNLFSCCVVLSERGYPENPKKGELISSSLTKDSPTAYLLHAGTKKSKEGYRVDGGRVLNAIGVGLTKEQARKRAYALLDSFPHHLYFRKDIGDS